MPISYQGALYLHGLKQRLHYHRQQPATRLLAAKSLEKERDTLRLNKDKLEVNKKRLNKDANNLALERNIPKI